MRQYITVKISVDSSDLDTLRQALIIRARINPSTTPISIIDTVKMRLQALCNHFGATATYTILSSGVES